MRTTALLGFFLTLVCSVQATTVSQGDQETTGSKETVKTWTFKSRLNKLPTPIPPFLEETWGAIRDSYTSNSAHLERGQAIAWGDIKINSKTTTYWVANYTTESLSVRVNYNFTKEEEKALKAQGWTIQDNGKLEFLPKKPGEPDIPCSTITRPNQNRRQSPRLAIRNGLQEIRHVTTLGQAVMIQYVWRVESVPKENAPNRKPRPGHSFFIFQF